MNVREGILRHVAGTGKAGYVGDGGPAASATFAGPKGIAVARNGDVFVVDSENNALRRIDAKTGRVETVVDGLNQPHGVCVSPEGDVFVGDSLNNRVVHVRGRRP
jgi:YVTN family beta-propeller protein